MNCMYKSINNNNNNIETLKCNKKNKQKLTKI